MVKNGQNNISYFVYGTWPGDNGEFEAIDKPLNNKKLLCKIASSHPPFPTEATACVPYLSFEENACTGCPWMIADYTSQLEQKRNRFVYAMQRAGFDTASLNIRPIQAAPHLYGYRNRCQIKTDGRKLGFISENSHQIAPVADCIAKWLFNR